MSDENEQGIGITELLTKDGIDSGTTGPKGGGRFILFIKCNTWVYNFGTAAIAFIIF